MAVIQFPTPVTNGTLTIGTPVSQKVSGTYLTLTVPEHYIRVNIPIYPANDSVARYYTVRYAFFKNGSRLSTTTGYYNSNTVANSYVDATLPSKTVTTSTLLTSLFSSSNPTEAYVPIEIKNNNGDMYLTNSAQYVIFSGSFSVSLGVINAYLDAPPTFDTSALSFNTTAPYAGATTASVTVSNTSAKYGGTITSVEFAIGEQTDTISGDGTLSIDLNAGGTFTPTVTVTDSRGQKSKYDFAPITVNVYDKPSVSFDVERTLSTGKPDDEGTYAVINPTFTFTDVIATLSAPTVTVTDQDGTTTTATPTWYSSRAQDGTLSGSVTWGNLSTGATVYGLISGFNTQYSYQISVTPEDDQDTGTTQTQTLGGAYYTVDFLAGGHGIAFGKPASNIGFECAMDATFVDANGVMRALFDFIYPVGSYYETSDTAFDPNVTWGGTWELEAEGLVHIGAGNNYTVGDTGGEATHTLTVNEMPKHSHTMNVWPNGAHYYTPSGSTILNWWSSGYGSAIDQATSVVGGDQAHNNMQPYIVVNRWHRTA